MLIFTIAPFSVQLVLCQFSNFEEEQLGLPLIDGVFSLYLGGKKVIIAENDLFVVC